MNTRLIGWRCLSVAMMFGTTLQTAGAGPKLGAPKLADPSSPIPKVSNQNADPKATASKPAGQKEIVRRPAETAERLAHRILPQGARTVTEPLEMDFTPLGKVILVLYETSPKAGPEEQDAYSIYWGWMLVPDGNSRSYHVEALPPLHDGYGRLEYTIKSVFAADADGDGSSELCILSSVYEIGSGDQGKDYYDTDIFKWSGTAFALVEQSDKRPLSGLRNAKAVRARLKNMLNRSVKETKALR